MNPLQISIVLFMMVIAGCGGESNHTCTGGSSCPPIDSASDSDSNSSSDTDADSDSDTDTCTGGSPCSPFDSDYISDVDDPDFDLSIDPGIDPVFLTDPFFTQNDEYVYVKTAPGDHELADGIVAVSFDVSGDASLREVLIPYHEELSDGYGLALYLDNGTALNDEDLDFLQHLNHDYTDWSGLGNLDTLHVYNLRTIQSGIESTTETAYGIPYPYLWENGWQSEDSEIMKGDSWVKHIVMDDLEEIPEGAFCDTYFYSMSFRGVRVVRQMGLGFAPRAPATELYMPSLEEAEMHAFRRRQRILKYYFPKLTTLGPFAIDDNSQMQYISAPALINAPTDNVDDRRNTFNDPRDLITFHFPKIEYLGLSCMGGTNDTTTVFRFPSLTNPDGSSMRGHTHMQFVWLPEATRLGPNLFIGNASLKAVYAPKVTDVGRYAFQDCISLSNIELPAAIRIRFNAFQGATSLEEVHLPQVETLETEVFKDLPNLRRVYLGDTPPSQEADVFAGTGTDLVIYYSGDDSAWSDWRPEGNDSAQVVKE